MSAAVASLSRHGRTFHLAGRLLPQTVLTDAAELYAFCRSVDDLADEAPDPVAAKRELVRLRAALSAGTAEHPLALQFTRLRLDTGVSQAAAIALVDTVTLDLGPVRVPDEAALLQYAEGAAGTVGLMMCAVLGVHDARASAYARDLGVAMQLTNIARDVSEDALRDRLYLPASWLPSSLGPVDVTAAPGPVFLAVQKVLSLAESRYRSAELGYRYLPSRTRPAIRVAARLYEEIGLRVLRQGPSYLQMGRCVVPMSRKMVLLARCLTSHWLAEPHEPLPQAPSRILPEMSA